MQSFVEYRKNVKNEAVAGEVPERSMDPEAAEQFSKLIDQFVEKLKMDISVAASDPAQQKGIWDRMKQWWSNIRHGKYQQKNPYYWQNVAGSGLGGEVPPSPQETPSKEMPNEAVMPFMPMTLNEYKVLHECAMALEEAIATPPKNLKLIRVIDNWAKLFKQKVMSLVTMQPKPSEIAKGQEPESMVWPSYKRGKPGTVPPESTAEPTAEPTAPVEPELTTKEAAEQAIAQWEAMSEEDKDKWDKEGGGTSGEAIKGKTSEHGIHTLPWILRIGDPRIAILKGIRGKSVYAKLLVKDRIETKEKPIEDLEQAVKLIKPDVIPTARIPTKKDKDADKDKEIGTAAAAPTTTGGKEGGGGVGTADIGGEQQTLPFGDEGSETPTAPPVSKKKEEVMTRHGKLRNTIEILKRVLPQEGEEVEEESIITQGKIDELLSKLDDAEGDHDEEPNEEKLEDIEGDLQVLGLERLEKEKIGQSKLKRFQALLTNKEFEEFEKLFHRTFRHSHEKETATARGLDLSHTFYGNLVKSMSPSEKKEYYKSLLQEQTSETYTPVPSRKKLKELSWDDKVKYFKELVAQ